MINSKRPNRRRSSASTPPSPSVASKSLSSRLHTRTKPGKGKLRYAPCVSHSLTRLNSLHQEIRLLQAGKVLAEGRVTDTQGKDTIITIDGADPDLGETDVDAIEIIGRDDLTNAEVARNSFINQLLQGKQSLQQSDFIRKIWFPSDEDKEDLNAVKATFGEKDAVDESEEVPEDTTAQVEPPPGLEKPSVEVPAEDEEDPFKETMLNPSQANVARAMVSKNSFALVHGPCVSSSSCSLRTQLTAVSTDPVPARPGLLPKWSKSGSGPAKPPTSWRRPTSESRTLQRHSSNKTSQSSSYSSAMNSIKNGALVTRNTYLL